MEQRGYIPRPFPVSLFLTLVVLTFFPPSIALTPILVCAVATCLGLWCRPHKGKGRKGILWGMLCGLAMLLIGGIHDPNRGGISHSLPPGLISRLGGRVVEDARFTPRGDLLITLELEVVWGRDNRMGSAGGRVLAIVEQGSSGLENFHGLGRGARLSLELATGFPQGGEGSKSHHTLTWSDLFAQIPTQPWVRGRLVELHPPQGLDDLRISILGGALKALEASPSLGLWQALVWGQKDFLEPSMESAFLESGCSHLIALSGMHLGVLASVLLFCLGPLLGTNKSTFLACGLALVFVWLAGPYPSLVRALIAFLLLGILTITRGPTDVISVFLVSSGLALALVPNLVHEVGFWLSVGALGGIVFLGPPLWRWARYILRPTLAEWLGTGLAATLGTVPFMVYYGLAIRPQGVLLGLVLAPLTLVHMALGTIVYPLGLDPWLVEVVYELIHYLALLGAGSLG